MRAHLLRDDAHGKHRCLFVVQRENVYTEMTLDQFYSFMAQMEKAKAYMDFLSAES